MSARQAWEAMWLPSIRNRALRVAGLVGTILVAINHLPAVLAGELNSGRILQMALTYCVPYFVSTYASVRTLLDHRTADD